MAATFCAILTAYLLGSFILQEEWIVERTRPFWPLVLRGAVVTSLSYLLLGAFHWRILLAILLTHVLMAAIKAHVPSDSAASFLVDQGVHLVVLLGLDCYFPDAAKNGWWTTGVKPDLTRWYFASLSCTSGIILCVPAGGVLIAAKSILRFGEIKDASQRKVAEYIIIGTFLSFGWALLISMLTQKAIKYWIQ
jgi:hypothetical protein